MAKRQAPHHHVYPLVLVELLVRFKPDVPDPEKSALAGQAEAAGFAQATITERAKYFRIKFANRTLRQARVEARGLAAKALANPVYETFEFLSVTQLKGRIR